MEVLPASAREKLGFDHVVLRLRESLISLAGHDELDALKPTNDRSSLESAFKRVSELQEVFRFDDPVPLEPMPDIRDHLRLAVPEGAYLEGTQLLEVAYHARTSRLVRHYFAQRSEKYPEIARTTSSLAVHRDLEDRFISAIDPSGSLMDDASPQLRRIRSLIHRRQAELRDSIMRELRRAIGEGWATEEQPTIRNGRMVIPVRAEARRKLQGFVQDLSASGQTVYIEPAASLDLNNELRELEGAERREVERILRELTGIIRVRLDELRANVDALARIDVLQAKARFGNSLDGIAPRLNTEGLLDIKDGRNPELELHFRRNLSAGEARERVVPLNLQLGGSYRTLVITGPNAGGKTIAMKTAGLFVLMAMHGIPIPADEKTQLPILNALLVDIGDQQSIEEDLSTFSSHVSNLRMMLERAAPDTLLLIDEAGSGTDPDEGSALAQAVLERFNAAGARTIVTTHHGRLKAFAHEEDGVENGSMEFDRETLSPTYRFVPGVPGSSYAFEIARRTGMDPQVLERARTLAGSRTSGLEDLIAEFETRNQELERLRSETKDELERARKESSVYRERRSRFDRERDAIQRQALEEAERIVSEANARVERTIREIKEAEAEREVTRRARQQLEEYRADLKTRKPEKRKPRIDPAESEKPISAGGPIKVGDQVLLDGGTVAAEVLEVDADEAVVAMGSMRMRVDTERLTRVGGKRKQQVTVRNIAPSGGGIAATTARSRVDLRGLRVDEALAEVQRILDEAIQTNQTRIELLHGKGTGALRAAIHDYLSQVPEVATFEDAPWNEGGSGVTYVTLH